MSERTKLYVDMLKGLSLGFLGAVLFREFSFATDALFVVGSAVTFAGAWFLTGER